MSLRKVFTLTAGTLFKAAAKARLPTRSFHATALMGNREPEIIRERNKTQYAQACSSFNRLFAQVRSADMQEFILKQAMEHLSKVRTRSELITWEADYKLSFSKRVFAAITALEAPTFEEYRYVVLRVLVFEKMEVMEALLRITDQSPYDSTRAQDLENVIAAVMPLTSIAAIDQVLAVTPRDTLTVAMQDRIKQLLMPPVDKAIEVRKQVLQEEYNTSKATFTPLRSKLTEVNEHINKLVSDSNHEASGSKRLR